MKTNLEYEAPTWNRTYKMLLTLADKIRRSGFKPDVIVGISRGGWVPARILSDLLENPNLANIRVEFYRDVAKTGRKPVLTQGVSADVKGKRCLIADDIADSGKTLALVKAELLKQGAEETKIATLYWKPWSKTKPDFYEKQTERWVVFPWEAKETIRRIKNRHGGNAATFENEIAKLVNAGLPKPLAVRFLKETSESEPC